MATRAELRERIRRMMRDEAENLFQDELINDAINFALGEAWPSWYIAQEDITSIPIVADTFRYSLPSDCEFLAQVWLQRGTNEPYTRLVDWRTQDETSSTGALTHYLYLDQNNNYEAGKYLRLIYEAKPPEITNDTDDTVVPTAFLIPMASSYLAESMIHSGPGKDVEHWKMLMQWNKQRAEDVRSRQSMQHISSTITYRVSPGAVDIYAQPGLIGRVRPPS